MSHFGSFGKCVIQCSRDSSGLVTLRARLGSMITTSRIKPLVPAGETREGTDAVGREPPKASELTVPRRLTPHLEDNPPGGAKICSPIRRTEALAGVKIFYQIFNKRSVGQ